MAKLVEALEKFEYKMRYEEVRDIREQGRAVLSLLKDFRLEKFGRA